MRRASPGGPGLATAAECCPGGSQEQGAAVLQHSSSAFPRARAKHRQIMGTTPGQAAASWREWWNNSAACCVWQLQNHAQDKETCKHSLRAWWKACSWLSSQMFLLAKIARLRGQGFSLYSLHLHCCTKEAGINLPSQSQPYEILAQPHTLGEAHSGILVCASLCVYTEH